MSLEKPDNIYCKGRVRKKKPEKMWSFAKLGGGGGPGGVWEKTKFFPGFFFAPFPNYDLQR